MRRRSPILLAVLALLASTAGLVLATSPAQADDPEDFVLQTYGYQEYAHLAGARQYFITPLGGHNTPAGVELVGELNCTGLVGGTPISDALDGGHYDLDPATCSGVSLTGPNAANYELKYSPASTGDKYYVYPGQIAPIEDATATGIITSMLKGKTTFSGRIRGYYNQQPIAGQPIVIWSELTPLPAFGGKICTTVTDANGKFTCNAAPISWSLVGMPYSVRVGASANYAGAYFRLTQTFS